MKRLFSLAFAAALLTAPIAAAQPYQGGPPPGFHPPGPPGPPRGAYPWGGPARPGWHHWRPGDRFQGSRYQINNWQAYHLPPPRPGYYWARSGGEFVMLGSGGIVGNVVISSGYP